MRRFKGCQRRAPKRGAKHFITDKRHFAGVKAARTRLVNRTTERILDVFDDKGMAGVAYLDQVRAILEDAL